MSDEESSGSTDELSRIFTCLPDKFVVDFANGIDVAMERQRHMSSRSSFFNRLYDDFTGKTARNQAEVNASLIDGVEGTLQWLVGLTHSHVKSNRAIRQVQNRVNDLKRDVATLAHYSANTRRMMEQVTQQLNARCSTLELEVARIGSLQNAHMQFDSVMGKWGAGRFAGLSLTGRCYAVLEELRWGAFGDHLLTASDDQRQQLLDMLIDKAIQQLNRDARIDPEQRIDTRVYWLARPTPDKPWIAGEEILAYLGDWSSADRFPMTFAISQMPEVLPLQVPLLGSANRMAEGLVNEVFPEASA